MKKLLLYISIVIALVGCQARYNYLPTAQTLRHPSEGSVTIAACGDIMVHGAQLKAAWDENKQGYDFSPVFSKVKGIISRADLAICNLETTLPGREDLYSGYPQFGTPDELAFAIKEAGIDIVTTANNHACDKGALGIVRTIDVLDRYGILHVGTYKDEEDFIKRRILFVERNDVKLAIMGYTYGTNGIQIPQGIFVNLIDRSQMSEDISLAHTAGADFIICLVHWGTEYERYPNDFQKELAEFLFSEGADVILGSHPHVLQPYELKTIKDRYGNDRERLVIYSLGNFVSNQRERYRDGGIILHFTLQRKFDYHCIADIRYTPTWVYVNTEPPKKQFYILPIPMYLNNDQEPHLPPEDYQKMLSSYQDTICHLRNAQQRLDKRTLSPPCAGVEF